MPIVVDKEHVDRLVIQAVLRFSPPILLPREEDTRSFQTKIHRISPILFQRPETGDKNGMPIVFTRDVRVPDVAVIKHQPLSLSGDQLEMGLIYKISESATWRGDAATHTDPKGFNALVNSIQTAFMQTFKDQTVYRFGKVYNYIFGPYDEDTNDWLRARFLRLDDLNDYQEGEVRIIRRREKRNFIHEIKAIGRADGKFGISVKLDVNNSDQTQTLSIQDVQEMLNVASQYHAEDFWSLLAAE